ncbi:MAG: hypothetical protein KC416_09385, partial [Myxococcales bacterium]|nr:hypothetical protein [Myxococcales bacterium]
MKRLIVALLLAFLGAAPSPGVQAQVELGTDGGHPGGDGAGGDGGTPIPPSLPALANPQAPSDAPTPEKNRTPPTAPLPQEALPAMELTLDPAGPISVGDRLTMNLTVDARRGDEITIPKDQSVAPLEILGTSHHQTEASTGRTVHQFRVDLLALDVGTIPIPPLTIRVVTQEGIVGEVQTPASEVEVRSVLGNEPNATPKGPSQPVEVIEDDYTLAYVAAAIGA